MLNEPTLSSPPPRLSSAGRPFADPDWSAPLDLDAATASIPGDAQLSGMFFLAMQARAKQRNVALPVARERYLQFNFYPLTEFIPLAIEGARHFYPGQSLREALRTMGRAAPRALIAPTIGKVISGSAECVQAAVSAMSKTYGINLRPSRVQVSESGDVWAVVRLENVPYFLDCHHVGVFEGVMLHAGVEGKVRLAVESSSAAEFLLTW